MKQKEFLEERKQSFIDQASENGSTSMEQLKEFEEQLKNIDEQIAQLTSMASNMEQAKVISSVKDQVDGRTRVLKAEIKSGVGNIEIKIEEAAELTSQSGQLTADMAEKLQETNASMAETEPVKTEEANSLAAGAEPKAEEANLTAKAQMAGEETEEEEG